MKKPVLVQLNQIDFQDKTFIFSYPLTSELVEGNIKEFGFVSPLVLKRKETSYQVVSGYKRLLGAKKNGMSEVYAFITDLDDYTAFRFAIYENTEYRRLNIFEISEILHKLLTDFKIHKKEILEDYIPLWGYNPHEKIFNQLLIPGRLNAEQREKVFNAQIEPEKIFVLGALPEDVWDIGITILTDMRPGANKFKHLIELAREIVQSEETTFKKLFADQQIKDIFLDPIRTSTQKYTQLRNILYARRNPVMTMVEEEYKKKYTQLNLDTHIKLTPPPGFEGSGFKVELNFKNKDELQKYATNLLHIAENPVFDELLNFL